MRPIKFRAWDRADKFMAPVDGTFHYNGRFMAAYNSDGDGGQCEGAVGTDCDLMQFTGLLDKNGKEIYEGDVVRGRHWKEPHAMRTSVEGVGVVEWMTEPPEFWIRGGPPRGYRTYLDFSDCEVIGNIYENPELLK